MFTGSFPRCANKHGVYDLNGNVWEVVESADGTVQLRGGAYDCADSELLHRCDYVPDWIPAAQGFRCCRDH